MSKAYTELYYHLVWATWKRNPFLVQQMQQHLYRYISHKCEECGYRIYAVDGMEDHIHLAVRLGPTVCVSEALRKLKGSSSHFCNNVLDLESAFKWQVGYGALTFGKRDLPKIVEYVRNQKVRHRDGRMNDSLEDCSER